jgi:hypothetical protein
MNKNNNKMNKWFAENWESVGAIVIAIMCYSFFKPIYEEQVADMKRKELINQEIRAKINNSKFPVLLGKESSSNRDSVYYNYNSI